LPIADWVQRPDRDDYQMLFAKRNRQLAIGNVNNRQSEIQE
jgi:hypothetical protein